MQARALLASLALLASGTIAAQTDSYVGFLDAGKLPLGTGSPLDLAVLGQPLLGASVSFNLQNPVAGGMHYLAFGPEGAFTPYADDSVLLVDLAAAALIEVPPDGEGDVSLTLRVPNDVALLGMDARAQYLAWSNGPFVASNSTLLVFGDQPGAPGYATMVFASTVVLMEEWAPTGSPGNATLDGTIAVDSQGVFSGQVGVSLPDGSVATVEFVDSGDVLIHTNDGKNTLDLNVYGQPATVIFNDKVLPLSTLVAQMSTDLASGSWTPMTRCMLSLSCVVGTEEFGHNAQTAILAEHGGARLTVLPGLCEATIETFAAWLTIKGDQGCAWLEKDCKNRGGRYFEWFLIDCEWLKWICSTGAIFIIALLREYLLSWWSAD